MDKKIILEFAKAILNSTHADKLETLHIDHTEYDDGSISVSIEMSYPAPKNPEENE